MSLKAECIISLEIYIHFISPLERRHIMEVNDTRRLEDTRKKNHVRCSNDDPIILGHLQNLFLGL
jgi:hypothetical protein